MVWVFIRPGMEFSWRRRPLVCFSWRTATSQVNKTWPAISALVTVSIERLVRVQINNLSTNIKRMLLSDPLTFPYLESQRSTWRAVACYGTGCATAPPGRGCVVVPQPATGTRHTGAGTQSSFETCVKYTLTNWSKQCECGWMRCNCFYKTG